MVLPDVHEHVAEEAPHLGAVAGVVDQGAFHEVGLVGLQDPLVQHDAVAHEDNNLQADTGDIHSFLFRKSYYLCELNCLVIRWSQECLANQNYNDFRQNCWFIKQLWAECRDIAKIGAILLKSANIMLQLNYHRLCNMCNLYL